MIFLYFVNYQQLFIRLLYPMWCFWLAWNSTAKISRLLSSIYLFLQCSLDCYSFVFLLTDRCLFNKIPFSRNSCELHDIISSFMYTEKARDLKGNVFAYILANVHFAVFLHIVFWCRSTHTQYTQLYTLLHVGCYSTH